MPSPRKPGVKQPQDHKPSIKERLRAKKANTVTYYLTESDEARDALAEINEMRQAQTLSRFATKMSDEQKNQLVDKLKAAEQAFEARDDVLKLEIRGLSGTEYSDLLDTYTPEELSDEDKKAGKPEPKFDLKGFRLAALELAVPEADMTAEEWGELLDSDTWSKAETDALHAAVQQATTGETPSTGIPKG